MAAIRACPGNPGMTPRDRGMSDYHIVVGTTPDCQAGTSLQVGYLDLLFRGWFYRRLVDADFLGDQTERQSEAADADSVAVFQRMRNSRIDSPAVDLCSVEAAQIGDMQGFCRQIELGMVARDHVVIKHYIIVRVATDIGRELV